MNGNLIGMLISRLQSPGSGGIVLSTSPAHFSLSSLSARPPTTSTAATPSKQVHVHTLSNPAPLKSSNIVTCQQRPRR